MRDDQVHDLLLREQKRQRRSINLIASENYISKDVSKALGSVFVNKYAEGYPGKRYYGGLSVVDELEVLTQKRALKLFKLSPSKWSVNVQALSGAPANLAVLHALVPVGKKIMALELQSGGHLSHGYSVSVTGQLWKQVTYGVDRATEKLDYGAIREIARKEKPVLIIAGYSAYPRKIDWKEFRSICDEVGALLLCDISHIAGLVAGGVHASPFRYADIVTTTTHKTLRGPRSALIFSRVDDRDFPPRIDKAVFPGLQGGPHIHQIAAVCVSLHEALQPEFKEYASQVVRNAQALSLSLQSYGFRIVSGGTDTHMVLVDVFGSRDIGGKKASDLLEREGIIVNKNMIPFDTRKPYDPSGIRLGTAAETTRGKTEEDFVRIAGKISRLLK